MCPERACLCLRALRKLWEIVWTHVLGKWFGGRKTGTCVLSHGAGAMGRWESVVLELSGQHHWSTCSGNVSEKQGRGTVSGTLPAISCVDEEDLLQIMLGSETILSTCFETSGC